MSIKVMSMVWLIDLPAMEKIILLRLADFADDNGRNVYPSVGRVYQECGASERHVRSVIKKFTADGLLVLVRPGGGRNRTAEYRIDMEALKRCTPCRVLDLSDAENPAPGAPIPDQKGAGGAEKGAGSAENPAPGAPNPPRIHQEPLNAPAREGTEASGIPEGQPHDVWEAVKVRFPSQVRRTWLDRLSFAWIDADGTAHLVAPSRFVADRVNQEMGEDLRRAFGIVGAAARRVSIEVVGEVTQQTMEQNTNNPLFQNRNSSGE